MDGISTDCRGYPPANTGLLTMALPGGTVNWPLLFGCIFTAFGPITTLFFILIGKRAQLIIIALTAAFIWLISTLISATIWQIIPALKSSIEATICITVVIQEIGRYTFYQLYSHGVVAIQKVTTTKHQLPLNDFTSSLGQIRFISNIEISITMSYL